jgi:hypothetical protein
MAYVTNPFQNLELRIPEAYRGEVERFCQTQPGGGAKPSPDDSPFERQVDIWFLAVCMGARRGRRSQVIKPHRFMTGEILSRDPSRIELLELLAISYTDDPWILEKPSEIMDLVNELAATGLPEVFALLKDGNAKPIWNLTDNLLDTLSIKN